MKQTFITVLLLLLAAGANAQCTANITPAGSSVAFCQGSNILLHAHTNITAGASFQWYKNGVPLTGMIDSVLSVSTVGSYSVVINNGTLCTATSSAVAVSANPLPLAQITPLPASATICSGASVVLSPIAAAGYTYQWQLNGVPAVGSTSATYTTTTPGVYAYIVISASTGCVNTSPPVTVTANTNPPPPVASSNSPVCIGDTVKFFAASPVAGATFEWFGPFGLGSGGQNPMIPHAQPWDGAKYWVRMTLNGCTSAADTTLLVISCLDSLWPGDANYDLIVDNNDILQIALGNGLSGYPRVDQSIIWSPHFCHDWTGVIGAVNGKHADCNGDGIISASDTNAVIINYSLTHPKHVHQPAARGTGLPDLYFDLTGIALTPGTTVSIPIKLGAVGSPMNTITGIAARVKVSGITPTNNLSLTYPNSWLGNAANTIRFTKAISAVQSDWAYARIDHHTVSGQGTIANLQLSVPANAAGQQVQLYFEDVRMVDSSGRVLSGYNVVDDSASIQPTGVAHTNALIESMSLSPNPAHNYCTLQLSMKQETSAQLQITDLVGRMVWESSLQLKSGSQRIDLPAAALLPGIYFVRLQTSAAPGVQALRWVKE